MKLSDRLQLIADEIKVGETMADIGCDHGFLPIYLMSKKKCPKAIMTDISEGSLQKAKDNCMDFAEKFDRSIHFDHRIGNGIDVLDYGEVDVVVIAGMGGLLICDILGWDLAKSRSIKRFILQPRNYPGKLRHWLYVHGFTVVKESLVREGKFICEIMTVETDPDKLTVSEKASPYSVFFDYPDDLIEAKGGLTKEYLQRKLEQENLILQNILENSKDADRQCVPVKERIDRLQVLMRRMEAHT
ncbi:tRNA (adenine(22)-N(1))-methyltransferase [Ihubacter sp. rT4E-8]|uniref:tRNA (adenine(22)-N(1))-methyltransferase n=1 Tax=Ihubacter sp. rT4E-8 TaxID=3242369 RepID=UPI003CEB63B5